jgi:hypothetical protein
VTSSISIPDPGSKNRVRVQIFMTSNINFYDKTATATTTGGGRREEDKGAFYFWVDVVIKSTKL